MSIKKKIAAVLLVIAILLLNIGVLCHKEENVQIVNMNFSAIAEQRANISVFYSLDGAFSELQKITVPYTELGDIQNFQVLIPSNTEYIRFDIDGVAQYFAVNQIYFTYENMVQVIDIELLQQDSLTACNDIELYQVVDSTMYMTVGGKDPYVAAKIGPTDICDSLNTSISQKVMIKSIIVVAALDLICLVALRFRKKVFGLPIELFQNRALILNLAKNDFKGRFAGSYLGIVWAFVQPIVTVVVYWFVFQVGLRSGNVQNYPFVLWLVAGLVPWFFFQEALNGGTNALIEYSYLVKKVVFKISTLPLVKVISALFIHVFFILFTLVLYTCYGYYPDIYTVQIVYYSMALFVFTLAICYTTSAVVIFFRDLSQIINIILQVGVWVTPIMWNIDDMAQRIPRVLVLILKANPLYYIVNGYRDALLHKVWFWERFDLTCLFWFVTAAIFAVGAIIFKRLKVHFADVL